MKEWHVSTLRETTASNTVGTTHTDALRETMIGELREMGAIRSDWVAEVFRAVPRHLFTLGAPLEEVYTATAAVHVKWDEHGVPISTVSAPELQAFMLEQADIRPGMNALEIGSGGVNAAMMNWLVGSEGTVTTVDIDPDVTDRASRLLGAAGYSRVNVVLADAENGVPEHAPEVTPTSVSPNVSTARSALWNSTCPRSSTNSAWHRKPATIAVG